MQISQIAKSLASVRTLAIAAAVAGVVAAGTTSLNAQGAAAKAAYQIDTVHSAIIFKVKHANAGYSYGRFNDFSGTVTWDGGAGSSIDVTVKTDSIDTANAKRDQHLKSPDFFNAKQFPTLTFKSTSIKPAGGDNFDLAGNITMMGVTKPVTAKVVKVGESKDPRGGERIGAEATFTIKRSDFGMNYGQGQLGDEVHLTVSIEAIKG